jgi:hypothetical protein
MMAKLMGVITLVFYTAIPVAAYFLVRAGSREPRLVAIDVALATIPMLLLAAFTWRLVWPRWKLVAKLLLQPCIYAILSVYVGHWSVLIAWVHQGVLGLGGHIWFSRKHGFTWYAVEDPERYVALSKQMVGFPGSADSRVVERDSR